MNDVKVIGAPGYEDFEGKHMMDGWDVDNRGRLCVVYSSDVDDYFVLPLKYVFPL